MGNNLHLKQVIVRAFRANHSLIPGPDMGLNKFEWFSSRFKCLESQESNTTFSSDESFFSRAYEWRLNMKNGEVKERYLTGRKHSMDFPMINENFTGLTNKYGYAQTTDLNASSISGMAKYGGLVKMYFKETRSSSMVEIYSTFGIFMGKRQKSNTPLKYRSFKKH